jgi:hypothetical protein
MNKNIVALPLLTAALFAAPAVSIAGTVTFAEFDGAANNDPIPNPPQGLPDDITAVWTGLLLHTIAGDTPMSVFPSADLADDDATIVFSGQVTIPSINVNDTSWGSPLSLVGRLNGAEVWRTPRRATRIGPRSLMARINPSTPSCSKVNGITTTTLSSKLPPW